jgi:hypothetical protein
MPDISPVYRQRNPESYQYYQCVEDHLETFEQIYDDRFPKQYGFLRQYVKNVIYRHLDFGILKNGFARVRCSDCGHEYLLAFNVFCGERIQLGDEKAMCSHVPNKGEQMVRYYGYYSNVAPGKRKKAEEDDLIFKIYYRV